MVDLNDLEKGNIWKYLGMKIVRNNEGSPGVYIKATENLKQVYGGLHGGIIATIIDAAVATTVNEQIGKEYGAATVELKVNYLRPPKHDDLYAFATLIKKGNQIFVGNVEVKDGNESLVAFGIATYMIRVLSS